VNFGHNRWREGPQQYYDAARWLNATPGALLLVRDSGLQECFRGRTVLHRVGMCARENWWLAEAPAAPECASKGTQERYEYGPDGRHAVAYAR